MKQAVTRMTLGTMILAVLTSIPLIAAAGDPSPDTASAYLANVMDQFHSKFFVYDDFLSAGNHFAERGQMCNPDDEDSVPPMDEDCTTNPHSGVNSIRCEFKAKRNNWGGWFFLNGAMPAGSSYAQLNWGDHPGSGHDLRGATRLSFWARGEKGGEKVKFFAFGVGRDPFSGASRKPHPDSAPMRSTGYITLTAEWKEYSIDLAGLDLSHILCGFAWQTKSTINRFQDIAFYLDDISYDKPRLDAPRFLVSYQTRQSADDFDTVLRNTAYSYDNAIALLAFLADGQADRARLIADALVYAQQHDRYFNDGRIRNAYQGGDLTLPPGWCPRGKTGVARLPGWWDEVQSKWLEDGNAVGTSAGNMAWSMLALLGYYEQEGGEQYLAAAIRMGDWVERHCRDQRGAGGYTAGYEGWEPTPTRLLYKSTEHNLDLYAAFMRLHHITGDARWLNSAKYAQAFVASMWDRLEGKFWTGTGENGVTPFRDVIPIDAQAWAMLALQDEAIPYRRGLDYADAQMTVGQGYDFNQDADGVWFEGTAQMAAAFHAVGQSSRSRAVLDFLRASQHPSGGIPASDRDAISTGFYLGDGTAWLYYNRLHVGATAWLVLADHDANPFWMGSRYDGHVAVAMAGDSTQAN